MNMSSEQEQYPHHYIKPEKQRIQDDNTFQMLVSYLDELGFFELGDVDQPLSLKDVKAFRDSLSPEQLQHLTRLEAAYSSSC